MAAGPRAVAAAFAGLVLVGAACSRGEPDGPGGAAYAPQIDPTRFTTDIDHPLLPLRPGSRWVYVGETDEGTERIVVEVTDDTIEVMGVTAVVVRDTVRLDGDIIEDTWDWFAQDDEGNVWYFGEDTKEYDNDQVVSAEGAWKAGVDGAQPGIVMRADPRVGDSYRQEYYKGEAEDMGEVLELDGSADVPFGSFTGVLITKDYTPLEPDVVEHKYYAPGVGLVLEVQVEGGGDRVELVEMTRG
jgi:hypothetical protein